MMLAHTALACALQEVALHSAASAARLLAGVAAKLLAGTGQ